MSKKKNKAKGKEMSEEEKALYLQAQEEMDLRKQQTVEQFLKDKLHEDEKSAEQSLWRLDEGWRTLFRLCKTQEQRNNIDVFKQTWERQQDHFDSCIKDLYEELKEKEHLAAQMHRCHLLYMSRIRELQKKRMEALQQEWESSIDKTKKCYNSQRVQMSTEDMLQALTLDNTDPCVHNKYEELLRETVSKFYSTMEFNEMSFQENKKRLVKKRKGQLKEQQQVLVRSQHELKNLTTKNQHSREALVRAEKELQNEKKKLTGLQSKHASDEMSEAELKEQLVGAEKQNQKLRSKMEVSNIRARRNLTELSIQSDRAAKNLKTIITQGEKVLRMNKLCLKMEDRLLMTEDIHKVLVESLDTEDTEEHTQKSEFPELRVLTHQHNVAIELRKALREQRNSLRRQNRQLRRQNEDMRAQRDHMEVRGGSQCRQHLDHMEVRGGTIPSHASAHSETSTTPCHHHDSPGQGSLTLLTPVCSSPVSCSTSSQDPGHNSPLNPCPELTPDPTL